MINSYGGWGACTHIDVHTHTSLINCACMYHMHINNGMKFNLSTEKTGGAPQPHGSIAPLTAPRAKRGTALCFPRQYSPILPTSEKTERNSASLRSAACFLSA